MNDLKNRGGLRKRIPPGENFRTREGLIIRNMSDRYSIEIHLMNEEQAKDKKEDSKLNNEETKYERNTKQ